MSELADRMGARHGRVLRDAFRTQLWPWPTTAVLAAVVAGVALPRLDARIDDDLPHEVARYLFGGGADAARSVLAVITGSLITVTALTFSITVVTLQLASSEFSPRLLRTFMSDRVVRGTLALFLATFVYALTVMRTVRTEVPGQAGFVPQVSMTVAFVLTVVSVLALVGFLSHVVREIRVETMFRNVHREASQTIQTTFPQGEQDGPRPLLPQAPADAAILLATSSGFLTSIDLGTLLDAAVETDAHIWIDRPPGSSLVVGTPVGRAWASDGAHLLGGDRLEGLREAVAPALHTGFERTAAQDIAFGLRQLTDVAVKALSPGINDPTTAVHALGHSSALLCDLAARDPGHLIQTDERGAVRVVVAGPDLADLLDLAVAQPRRYGASDPALLARLFTLLRELAWASSRTAHRRAVAEQLGRLRRTVAEQDFDKAELRDLTHLAASVEAALDRRWQP